MRHAKKGYKLSRTASHRKATLAALSGALIRHKRITTTLTKAKALRIYVEPLITRARVDTTHNRREVFRHLMDKAAVTELFDEISEKVGDRPGGYTRVLRLGQRQGDAAEMAVIELVDYNDSVAETGRTRRRRTRRGGRRRGPTSRQVEVADAATISSPVEAEDAAPDIENASAEDTAPEVEDVSVEDAAPEAEDVSAEDTEPEAEDVSAEDTVPEVEDASAEDAEPEAEDVSTEDAEPEVEDASAEDAEPEAEDASTEDAEPEVEDAPSADDAENSAEPESDQSATGGKESTPS